MSVFVFVCVCKIANIFVLDNDFDHISRMESSLMFRKPKMLWFGHRICPFQFLLLELEEQILDKWRYVFVSDTGLEYLVSGCATLFLLVLEGAYLFLCMNCFIFL